MEFDDLLTFVSIAEAGSVSQAARQLFITQPAVTRRLQRLETALGTKLVDRRRRPFTLTATGHGVLAECRKVLNSVREVRAVISRDGTPSGELRIGVAHALTEIALTEPLDNVRRKFPSVNFALVTGWSRQLFERVRSGSLDAAIILLPEENKQPPDVKSVALGKERLVVVAAKRMRSRKRKLADLRRTNWILNPEGCGARAALERTLHRADVEMHVGLETYNYDLQLRLVARNRGLSLVPSRILNRSGLRSRLRELRISGLEFPLAIWSVRGQLSGNLDSVVEELNQQLIQRL
jgi:DNA-binding transcriptional LysR family regulator